MNPRRPNLYATSGLRRGLLLIALLVTIVHSLPAQEKLLPVLHFNHLTANDGLPSNNINCAVVRDSKGFVWIGTGNGLSRYDGYGFKTYFNQPNDSTSLSSSMINMLKEDSKHRLWVGTWDAGLSLYDPGRDCFINFYPRPGDSTWLQTRSIYTMLEDSAGVLWFGTSNGIGGIIRVDLPDLSEASTFADLARGIHFRTYHLGTPRNGAYDLCMQSDGRILVASDRGLLFLDRKTGTISRPDFPDPLGRRLNSVVVWRLVQDQSSNIWHPTSGGLFKIHWPTGKILIYRHTEDDNLSIARDNLLDAALERHGNIWIASSEGVDIFSPATCKRMPYLTFGSTPIGTANVALYVDKSGTLWISTGGGGLYWRSEKSMRFPHYSVRTSGGGAQGFESIERTRQGGLWLCSYGSVSQLDVHTQTLVKSIDVMRGAKATYCQCTFCLSNDRRAARTAAESDHPALPTCSSDVTPAGMAGRSC
jgi:ligand-binding sensor domain-containing protein